MSLLRMKVLLGEIEEVSEKIGRIKQDIEEVKQGMQIGRSMQPKHGSMPSVEELDRLEIKLDINQRDRSDKLFDLNTNIEAEIQAQVDWRITEEGKAVEKALREEL